MKYEFGIMASITELVEYPDEQNDAYIAHPNFQIIMDQLGITVPVAEIYEHFLPTLFTTDMCLFTVIQCSQTLVLSSTLTVIRWTS